MNRVIFDTENRAVGIEYQRGGKGTAMLTAYASRLVVISAGTYCSPAILERCVYVDHGRLHILIPRIQSSGIGAKDLLEQYGIPTISDLPGVGQNYIGKSNS